MRTPSIICGVMFLGLSSAFAADTKEIISMLKGGDLVIVFRHGETDNRQKDIYPFKFDDMTAQRQLSEKGREAARQIGSALKDLAIPVGDVFASKLHRAIETGELLTGKQVVGLDALTDSSAGSASGMANPAGANTKAGLAMRNLVNTAPKAGTNTLLVTHKTNFADAFGKEAGDVQEAEAFVYRPNSSGGPPTLIGRVEAADWTAQTAKH